MRVATHLQQPTRGPCGPQVVTEATCPPIWSCSGWGLPCHYCYQQRGALLPHHFTLTMQRRTVAFGGIFSAALSVGLRLPGVTWHPALRSPDFPLSLAGQRSFGRLPGAKIVCKRVYRNRYLSVYMLPTSSISNRIRLFPRKNRGNSQVGHCFSADFLLLETMEFETGPKDV